MRKNRSYNKLRNIVIQKNFMDNAFSSCLFEQGKTKVICSASIETKIPRWLKGKGKGWITAEYSMLPTATEERNDRESVKGKLSGRTQEIQRFIGRSLRSVTNLYLLKENIIKIDCDVISADGGTRTASINGSWIALSMAVERLILEKNISKNPILCGLSAISCGIVENTVLLDLDYKEDSKADADANFVFDGKGKIVEIQCTGEARSISNEEFSNMFKLAKEASSKISILQKKIVSEGEKNKFTFSDA